MDSMNSIQFRKELSKLLRSVGVYKNYPVRRPTRGDFIRQDNGKVVKGTLGAWYSPNDLK